MPNVIDLLVAARTSEKAWRKGGGGGASSGIGGGRGKGPGSRGGNFFINREGHVEYGPKPSGARGGAGGAAKPQVLRTHGPSQDHLAKVRANRNGGVKPSTFKPQTSQSRNQSHHRMLAEMENALKTGKDPHGNRLNSKQLIQLNSLAHGLRRELNGSNVYRNARAGSGKTVTKKKEFLPIMPLAVKDPGVPVEQVHTGVMIALMVPGGIGQAIAVPGGESLDDLHLTLAYLGDSSDPLLDENRQLIFDALDEFSRTAKPLTGEISGVGLFNNGGDGLNPTSAFYASFDSPDLTSFRATLLGCLSMHGIDPVSNHGFTPHITLAYIPKGSPLPPVQVPQLPVTFEAVTLCWGDQQFVYMLDKESLKPREADGYTNNFDTGLDATSKEIKAEIATKEIAAQPFTAYKDINGRWRWLIRSSSSFKDRDGETVSQKALEGAAEKLNATGKFGILDWWHTPANLGPCDFSAMHGRVLVESGTFVNEAVGERIAAAIANKSFKPGASLMFAHNEPGPAVLAGRVFNDIQIIQRSLLPEEIASNAATTMEIVNLADSLGQASNKTKEVKRKMDAAKEAKLRELLGPQLVEQFLSGSELAEKQLEMTGLSWKALAPAMDKNAANATQLPAAGAAPAIDPTKKKLDTKAEGVVMPAEGSPAEELAETPEEEAGEEAGGYEDSQADDAADALMQGLYDEIDRIVQTRLEAASKDILAALSGVNSAEAEAATATKAVSDLMSAQTLALKENTTAMNAVVAENKSLKARLDALEGKQPAAVRARTSQGAGIPATELPAAHQELVNPAQKEVDPYAKIVEQLGLIPFSKGAV